MLLQQISRDQFHLPRAANVCLQTPTPSFHAARWSWKNNVRWGFIDGLNHFINASTPRLSYLFQTSTKAPFYSLCDLRLKLLQEKKLMISFAEKGCVGFGLTLQFLFDNPVLKYSSITVKSNDHKEKLIIKMSPLHWVWFISQFGMVFAHHLILYAVWCFGILLERRVYIWHLKLFLSENLLL